MPYKDRDERFKRGLCNHCPNPVAPHAKRCSKCLATDSRTSRIRQAKKRVIRIDKGLCAKCGVPLHEDADKGRINCISCREADKWNYLIRP